MAKVRIGDAEAQARVSGALDAEVVCEFPPTREARRVIAQALPGTVAVVTIAGQEYQGLVRITDPGEFATVVEF